MRGCITVFILTCFYLISVTPHSIPQSISQSISQSIPQSISQSIPQSNSQSIAQSTMEENTPISLLHYHNPFESPVTSDTPHHPSSTTHHPSSTTHHPSSTPHHPSSTPTSTLTNTTISTSSSFPRNLSSTTSRITPHSVFDACHLHVKGSLDYDLSPLAHSIYGPVKVWMMDDGWRMMNDG